MFRVLWLRALTPNSPSPHPSQEWTALQNLPSLPRDLTTVDLGVGCDPDDDDASCAPVAFGDHQPDDVALMDETRERVEDLFCGGKGRMVIHPSGTDAETMPLLQAVLVKPVGSVIKPVNDAVNDAVVQPINDLVVQPLVVKPVHALVVVSRRRSGSG